MSTVGLRRRHYRVSARDVPTEEGPDLGELLHKVSTAAGAPVLHCTVEVERGGETGNPEWHPLLPHMCDDRDAWLIMGEVHDNLYRAQHKDWPGDPLEWAKAAVEFMVEGVKNRCFYPEKCYPPRDPEASNPLGKDYPAVPFPGPDAMEPAVKLFEEEAIPQSVSAMRVLRSHMQHIKDNGAPPDHQERWDALIKRVDACIAKVSSG